MEKKLEQEFQEFSRWGEQQGIETVEALNEQVVKGSAKEVILVQEALQEKKIAELATMLADHTQVKFVLIAGPSSSGKTTFSHRLSIQLRANGRKPHPIAVDDYFKNREDTPRDEKGNYDFESLEAVDVKQFNEDLTALLEGKEVALPTFNFKTGKREYQGRKLRLGEDDILVIEGIHCLNHALTYALPAKKKFQIYISALNWLKIDEEHRLSTTDGRLLRRIVRDSRVRGISAKQTIAMWASVRRGEENNIFPHQEKADVMFNSALIYEWSVLKIYVEPLLLGIEADCREYEEARRLRKLLESFVAIGSETVPNHSLLREFIGGGCFEM